LIPKTSLIAGIKAPAGSVAGVEIREATGDDWAQIWPFFQRIVLEGETYAYPEDLTPESARELWFEPGGHVVVAVDGPNVLGTAKTGPNRPGRGRHVSTASFMVDSVAAGKGVGRALGEYVLGWARDAGFRSMQFNAVVETNTAAVRLWHSLGFEVIGTVPEAFDHPRHGYVGLHDMYRRL
jgi:L-amino acid N-acyltransferase YncA